MIRIFLPLILAVVAFFGAWGGGQSGFDFAAPTVNCFLDLKPSFASECLPNGALGQQLIGYTVVLGAAAAVLSVIGLLPLVGRLTSVLVIGSGMAGVIAAVMAATGVFGGGSLDWAATWGIWATALVGLATAFVGLNGVRGETGDY